MSVLDEYDILRLQLRYAALNDAGQWEETAALFTEDARFVRPSAPDRPILGRAAILAAFLARPAGPNRRHLVANPVVRMTGPDSAEARCISIVITEAPAGSGTVTVGGFDDLLERQNGTWRFASRQGFTEIDPVPFPQA